MAYAAGREPQVSTIASRTIRWGGVLILIFLVYHILHFTLGTVHTAFVEGDPYHNVATGFSNPLVVVFYELAMAAVGLHLYHGIWSSRPEPGDQHAIASPPPAATGPGPGADRLGRLHRDSDRGLRRRDPAVRDVRRVTWS